MKKMLKNGIEFNQNLVSYLLLLPIKSTEGQLQALVNKLEQKSSFDVFDHGVNKTDENEEIPKDRAFAFVSLQADKVNYLKQEVESFQF